MARQTQTQHTPPKRVLIVAYHFPPDAVAGATRPGYLAKYLPEFGWEPTVLTAASPSRSQNGALDGMRTVVSARDLLDRPLWPRSAGGAGQGATSKPLRRGSERVKQILKNIVWFPDRALGWIPMAIKQALAVTSRTRFDAVISTCPPASAHVIGWFVAMRRGIPWIADYRDLWYGNPHSESGPFRAGLERALECRMLRRAHWVVTVRDYYLAHQQSVFNVGGDTIPNAYDPSEWAAMDDAAPKSFDLCYAGTLYGGKRRLDFIFAAVARLRAAGDPAGIAARFHIYGPDDALANRLAADHGVADIVTTHGQVERDKALRAQRNAAVLVIPLSMAPETTHDLCSKIFECVGARRRVIAIGPPGSDIAAFIARHDLGWFASDEAGCADTIRAAYALYVKGELEPPVACADEIATARGLAGRFAHLLDCAVESSIGPPVLRAPLNGEQVRVSQSRRAEMVR